MITETHTFEFADGRTLTVPLAHVKDGEEVRGTGWRRGNVAAVIGIDEDGLAVSDFGGGFNITVTNCCGASFKGCDGYIGCRACYREVEGSGLPWGDVVPLKDGGR